MINTNIEKWYFVHACKTAGFFMHKNICPKVGLKHSMNHDKISDYTFDIRNFSTVVTKRNPYDRVYSMYCYYNNTNGISVSNLQSFVEIIPHEINKNNHTACLRPITEYLEIDGKIKADYILDFHNLEKSLTDFLRLFNIEYPESAKGKIKNKNPKKTQAFNLELFNKKTIDLVNKIYEKDFLNFDYRFA